MHLNLWGKQTHHPPAEVETEEKKSLFLLQNTQIALWSSLIGLAWDSGSWRQKKKIRGLIHTKEQLQTEKRPWWDAGEAGLAGSWSHHPSPGCCTSCSSASCPASNRPGAGVASLLAGYYRACQPANHSAIIVSKGTRGLRRCWRSSPGAYRLSSDMDLTMNQIKNYINQIANVKSFHLFLQDDW